MNGMKLLSQWLSSSYKKSVVTSYHSTSSLIYGNGYECFLGNSLSNDAFMYLLCPEVCNVSCYIDPTHTHIYFRIHSILLLMW